MRQGSWDGLDLLGRRAVPFALGLGLVIFSVLPWPLPGAATVAPLPLLGAVYYWTVHRPELMPAAMVFVLGAAQDILTGGPLGLTALMLLVAQRALIGQARHVSRGPFLADLLGFAVTAAAFGVVSWVGTSVYYGRLISPNPLAVQFLLGLCVYPILNWVLGLIHAAAPGRPGLT